MAATRKVTITDATLAALAVRPDAVAKLPHLLGALAPAALPVAKAGCKKCQVEAERRDRFARARRAIAALSDEDIATLKSLLSAAEIEVYVAGPGKGPVARVAR